MSDQDGFDARLAAHFEQEHRHVSADTFVATTMRKVRAGRRRREVTHVGLRVAALVAAVMASPWLIAGVTRLNAALDSSLTSDPGQLGAWRSGRAGGPRGAGNARAQSVGSPPDGPLTLPNVLLCNHNDLKASHHSNGFT